MRLKDRPYIPGTFGGKGYKIIRQNIVTENRSNSNILTQDMLSESNTVYAIRYDFDLGGAEITVPEGCTLRFDGGSLKNGTIIGNKTIIESDKYSHIFRSLNLKGSFDKLLCSVCWFGAITSSNNNKFDCSLAIEEALSQEFSNIYFPKGTWYVSKTINIEKPKDIYLEGIGENKRLTSIINKEEKGAILFTDKNIDLLFVNYPNVQDNFQFNLFGGQLDVSYVNNYTKNVVHISADNESKIWGCHINTSIKGKDIASSKTGIYIDGNASMSGGYISYINVNSNIDGFENGIIVEETNNAWITNFIDNSDIINCKHSIILNGGGMAKILGSYQPNYVSPDANNDLAVVIVNVDNVYLACNVWDIKVSNPTNGYYTNQWAFEFKEKANKIRFGGNALLHLSNCKNLKTSAIDNYYQKYPLFINERFGNGYNDLYNWLILGNGFTASYEITEGATVENFENLFLPYAGKSNRTTIRDKGVENIVFTVNIDNISSSYLLLLVGVDLNVYRNAQFRKVSLDIYPKSGEIKHYDINIEQSTGDLIKRFYFTGFEDAYLSVKKMVITFSEYNSTIGYAEIESIFSKRMGKTTEFLTSAGGNINGNILKNNKYYSNGIFNEDQLPQTSNTQIGAYAFLNDSLCPVWHNGNSWVYYDGIPVKLKRQGTFAQKPLSSQGIPIGYQYFCTDKQTTEGATNGIMLYHKGGDVWVDALGRVVS